MSSVHGPSGPSARPHATARVRRNFWALVAATVVAAGVLSQALDRPAGLGTAAVVAVSGFAAAASVALAGRILIVTTQLSRHHGQSSGPPGRKA